MNFQTHKTFIEVEGILYQVLKIIKEHHKPVIDTWKEHLGADRCFRQGDSLFFVMEVPEAELVIEEETKAIEAESIEEKVEEPETDTVINEQLKDTQ